LNQSCFLQNKETKFNKEEINKLTHLVDSKPLEFISKLKLDTMYLAHYSDSLGFDFILEKGVFKFNNKIAFNLNIIKRNDSIVSFNVKPFCGNLNHNKINIYNKLYKNAGWELNNKYDFNTKYYNLNYFISPNQINGFDKYKSYPIIDSLLNPYNSFYYIEKNKIKTNDKIIEYLDETTVYYLLNSKNPSTRVLILSFIKCNQKVYNKDINKFIENLYNDKTKVNIIEGCSEKKVSLLDLTKECSD
jgi:hypothetical protein